MNRRELLSSALAAVAASQMPPLQGDDGGGVDHHLCPECGGRDGKHEWKTISRTVHPSGAITLCVRFCSRRPWEEVRVYGPLLPKRLVKLPVE